MPRNTAVDENKEKRKPYTGHLQRSLYWNLTSLCNLRCDFCGVSGLNEDKSYVDQEVDYSVSNLEHFLKAIRKLSGQWEVFIGGGEPFVFPEFNLVVKSIVEMGHVVSVATNFTLPTKKYLQFCDIIGDNMGLFLASYKPWVHSLDEFMEKARLLNGHVKASNGKLSVGAVATEKETRKLYEIGLQFRKENIEFSLQVERVNGDYRSYQEDEEAMIRFFGRTYGLGEKKNFKGKMCEAGSRYFVLTPRGDGYRCHSACAYPKAKNGYLGNVVAGTFSQSKTSSQCPYPVCNCINAYNMKLIDL